MAITPTPRDYWAQRLAQAMENASRASTKRCRAAYLDLAAHYLSMHVITHGKKMPVDFSSPAPRARSAAGRI